MEPSQQKRIANAALKAAGVKAGAGEIRAIEEDTVPSTGQPIYRVHVAAGEYPNEAARVAVLDDRARAVDLGEIEAREGKRLFEAAPAAPGAPHAGPAATIDPTENVLTLHPGDSLSEVVTVTIPKSAAPANVDVYFLADTTGSMDSILSAVKAGAANILATLAGLGPNFQFGVGNYRDFPNDPYCFQHQQSITASGASLVAAINAWTAAGGGDGPEGQLFALHKLAEPPGGGIGWRPGSKRIIVWFGDNPGHDPVCAAISGEPAAITEASVTARLVAESITVLAISVLSPGLDADPKAGAGDYTASCGAPGGAAGQGTRIAAATGGQFVSGISPGNIVNTIISLVTAAVGNIGNVKLVASGGTAPFVASISPAGGYGPLPGDQEHVLKFDVVFRGRECKDEEQVFTGSLDAVADGHVIASKRVRITVPACPRSFVYAVKFICGEQPDCACECTSVRPGRYATAITLLNHNPREVKVVKRVVPLVFAGAPVGREPAVSGPRAEDRIVLAPLSGTMDDCCRLSELLLGGTSGSALNIGYLEITADAELSVTAVYTTTGPGSPAVAIDVQEIRGRRA